MNARSVLSLALVCGLGLACGGLQGQPVPPGHQDLVGRWTGDHVTLEVTAGGHVSYEKDKGGFRVEINGPVTTWAADSFTVGAFGVDVSTFRVDVPPHQAGGQWEATIDGVTLTRL